MVVTLLVIIFICVAVAVSRKRKRRSNARWEITHPDDTSRPKRSSTGSYVYSCNSENHYSTLGTCLLIGREHINPIYEQGHGYDEVGEATTNLPEEYYDVNVV